MNERWTPYDEKVEKADDAMQSVTDVNDQTVKWLAKVYIQAQRTGYLRALDDLGITDDPREWVALPRVTNRTNTRHEHSCTTVPGRHTQCHCLCGATREWADHKWVQSPMSAVVGRGDDE